MPEGLIDWNGAKLEKVVNVTLKGGVVTEVERKIAR